MAELTCEPRWAFGAGVGNGNASVLSRASMVDEPSTLKIELIYWPATTFAARAEAQAALFRYIDGWQKPRRIQQGLVGRSPDEFEAAWQARQRQPARLPSNARAPKSPDRKDNSPGNRGGVCGHDKMVRSVQKSQLLIEQTEEFVSHLFDAGHLTEAKRLAVTLRVQLHHGLNGYF